MTQTDSKQMNIVGGASSLIFKEVIIKGKRCFGLIDTGADLCLMTSDIWSMIGKVILVHEKVKLYGIGESAITTVGRFDTSILIDGHCFDVTFHVVNRNDINHDIVLGNSLFSQAEITIKGKEVIFKKLQETNL